MLITSRRHLDQQVPHQGIVLAVHEPDKGESAIRNLRGTDDLLRKLS